MPTPKKYLTLEERRQARAAAQRARRKKPLTLTAVQTLDALDACAQDGITASVEKHALNVTDVQLLKRFAESLRYSFLAEVIVRQSTFAAIRRL
jgi:hypothetical protein